MASTFASILSPSGLAAVSTPVNSLYAKKTKRSTAKRAMYGKSLLASRVCFIKNSIASLCALILVFLGK